MDYRSARSCTLSLLVLGEDLRRDLMDLLKRNGYSPLVVSDLKGTLEVLKGKENAIIFVDGEAVRIYGLGIHSRVRQACRGCRMILLCDHAQRDLVKEAMSIGFYGSILEPYAEWEVLTIVRHILSDTQSKRKQTVRKAESKVKRDKSEA